MGTTVCLAHSLGKNGIHASRRMKMVARSFRRAEILSLFGLQPLKSYFVIDDALLHQRQAY